MLGTLLYDESPAIGIIFSGLLALSIFLNLSRFIIGLLILILIFLFYFYRYEECNVYVDDYTILSPCEGTVLGILDKHNYYYIPIFLSPFNKHTQIYPVNGNVVSREYDTTGQFAIVMNLDKSRDNEKRIHYIQMLDGTMIQMTQIAGFLPRVIVSDDDLDYHQAGEYFGMIKFGSRIDLIIPKISVSGKTAKLFISADDTVGIGCTILKYI